jgi:hypothetical protein
VQVYLGKHGPQHASEKRRPTQPWLPLSREATVMLIISLLASWRLTDLVLTMLLGALAFLVVVAELGAPLIVARVLAPGFGAKWSNKRSPRSPASIKTSTAFRRSSVLNLEPAAALTDCAPL